MPTINHTSIQCNGAVSDLILQSARQVMPAIIAAKPVPNCSARNQPLLPLLEGLLDATQVTAEAIADNAWDESLPLNRELMNNLARQARAIAAAIETASTCPDARASSMAYAITYHKNNEIITLEWVAPSNWSETAIRESFEQQYPQAEIIRLEAVL